MHEVDQVRLAEVCERFGVVELAVFGSVARDGATGESDIDLLCVLGPDRHLGFSINRLEDELTTLLGRRVDLVSRRALHRAIRDEVLADARTIYAA